MIERKTNSTNYLNQSFLENKCPLNELLFLLSKRWMTEVLFCIEEGNNRFSGIREELEHISDHILADRLKLLEKDGFISKQYFDGMPPKVEYSLTARGEELSGLLDSLCNFASAGKEANSCS
jgi:DNA-binding HxlR family transcriptional regulator